MNRYPRSISSRAVAASLMASASAVLALGFAPAQSATFEPSTGDAAACPAAAFPNDRATLPIAAKKAAKTDRNLYRVAARNSGWKPAAFDRQATDPTLRIDACGFASFADAPYIAPTQAKRTPLRRYPTTANVGPFALHSRPGSTKVLYLDFTGVNVVNRVWNKGYNSPSIVSVPFSTDNDRSTFSAADSDVIRRVWQLVAEDFAPYDIDVTTEEPSLDALDRSTADDNNFGLTVVISTGDNAISRNCPCGGTARTGTFLNYGTDHMYQQPAWVLTEGTGLTPKPIAEAASHEAGHVVGLGHDGTSGSTYYKGDVPWAPIMGQGYYQPIAQWSKGQYPGANNGEDDTLILGNRIGLVPDEDSNTKSTARTLVKTAPSDGVISTAGDVDFLVFKGVGSTTVTVDVAPWGANLDVSMRIIDASGKTLATVNPAATAQSSTVATGLGATYSFKAPTGGATYYVAIDGVGTGDPSNSTKYSDYGSLGNYRVSLKTG